MVVEGGAPNLQSLLEIPGLRDLLLTHFHPRRLEDIQGVVSLWSMGLWRDDQIREHFLGRSWSKKGECRLSPDMDIGKQRLLVLNALELAWDSLRDLSKEELWSRYQFLSVIPKNTCRFVVESLKHRKMVMNIIMSRNVNDLTKNQSILCLVSASRAGMIDTVSSIVASGKIRAGDGPFTQACIVAARNGLTDMVDLLITKGNATIEDTSANIWPPLLVAAQNGHTDVVDLLITKGIANIEATDDAIDRTALMWAADYGQTIVVDLLITKGNANVEAIDEDGCTALMLAAGKGHADVVNLLITKGIANIEATDDVLGRTALIWASEAGHTEVVDLLITKGKANVEDTDHDGWTALMFAAKRGHTGLVHLLITKGNAHVEASDVLGRTALILAASHGHTDIVHRLISRYNANVEAADQDGKTVLSHAAQNDHTDIVDLLDHTRQSKRSHSMIS